MQESAGASAEPSDKARAVSDPLDDEDIPMIQPGVPAMAMFVPLESSLFEPFDAPRDKIDRLEICQQNIEKHSAAVQQNILLVYEREHRRILRHAKTLEASTGFVETTAGLLPGEDELIMSNVEAPMPAGADYSDRHMSTYNMPDLPPDLPPRQAALQWSLYNSGQALNQLAGYASHAQEIKDHYRTALQKELALQGLSAKNQQESEPARS